MFVSRTINFYFYECVLVNSSTLEKLEVNFESLEKLTFHKLNRLILRKYPGFVLVSYPYTLKKKNYRLSLEKFIEIAEEVNNNGSEKET